MEQQVNVIENGFERIQAGFRNVGGEFQKLQDRASENGRNFGERAQAQAAEFQKQLLDIPVVKAADEYRGEVYKQVEASFNELLQRLPVVSQDDFKKLEKKVNAMSRKIRSLEKSLAEFE